MTSPQSAVARMLEDGRRLHLHHGPIDLIIEAFGSGGEHALEAAKYRFTSVLDELVSELIKLREPCKSGEKFTGTIANRMQNGVEYFLPEFITPMAAVAGSVADEILDAISACDDIEKIYVNNGGDTSIYLTPGSFMKSAIAVPGRAEITIGYEDNIRGIATSGWRGRSHSLGIADSVSVLARTCSRADAAATMIANAVNLPNHPNISHTPAFELSPDSDLGDRQVTTDVGELTDSEIETALDAGASIAGTCVDDQAITGAILFLKDRYRLIGEPNLNQLQTGDQAVASL